MDSKRFPGKALYHICGKPLLYWTSYIAKKTSYVSINVTPDIEIRDTLFQYKIGSVITSNNPRNGTERCAELFVSSPFRFFHDDDIIINVQGDMVLYDPASVRELVRSMCYFDWEYGTIVTDMPRGAICDINRVKCSIKWEPDSCYFYAHDFSRGMISETVYLHVGIYGYTVRSLKAYLSMAPTHREKDESLEQLRLIENGLQIGVVFSDKCPIVIDCLDDVSLAERHFKSVKKS